MAISDSLKEDILKNQKNECKRCNKKLENTTFFYHKIGDYYKSISGDGSDNPNSIVGLCYECHSVIKEREKMKKQFDTSGDGVHLIG